MMAPSLSKFVGGSLIKLLLLWVSFALGRVLAQQKEVVFIVDGSGSISNSDWELQKLGMRTAMLDPNHVPLDGSVAIMIVQFSRTTRLELGYTVIGNEADRDSVVSTIDAMSQLNGGTGPQLGINRAITELIPVSKNAAAVQNFCLTTDGIKNTGSGSVFASIANAQAASFALDAFAVIAIIDGGLTPARFEAEYGSSTFGTGSLFVASNTAEFANTVGPLCFSEAAVKLVGMEVTQAVQDLENSVPLIAKKKTLLRAYFEPTDPTVASVEVQARLHGTRGGTTLPGSPITAKPDKINAKQKALERRNVKGDSMNFDLPANWVSTVGSVEFRIEVVGGQVSCGEDAGPVASDCKATVMFTQGHELKVKFVKVGFKASGRSTPVSPIDGDLDNLEKRLLAIFPTPVKIDRTTGSLDVIQRIGQRFVSTAVAAVDAMRARECAQDQKECDRLYYGVIASSVNAGAGGKAAGIPSFASVGLLRNGGNYGRNRHAHEIGHSMGLHHVVTPDNAICDRAGSRIATPFPFLSQVNSVTDVATIGPLDQGDKKKVYGWDSNQNVIIDPTEAFELMSYCGFDNDDDRWISTKTYERVRGYIDLKFDPARKLQAARELQTSEICIYSVEIDNNSGTSTISPVYCYEGNAIPSELEVPSGSYQLVLRDGAGNELSRIPFEPTQFVSDTDPIAGESTDSISTAIFYRAADAAIKGIGVQDSTGTELGSIVASANVPTVTVTFPNGGETLSGDSVEIQWTASDADGDTLFFTVEFSADGGTTWETLVIDHPDLTLSVPLADLAQTSTGLVRVSASDGFNNARDRSDAVFTVPNSLPTVTLESPVAGTTFSGVQLMTLRAFTSDKEDGTIAEGSIVWTSDIDGTLGTGSDLSVVASSLTEASHMIGVTATDSSGSSATDTVGVDVLRVAPAATRTCQPARRTLLEDSTAAHHAEDANNPWLRGSSSRALGGDDGDPEQTSPCGQQCLPHQTCEVDAETGQPECVCEKGYFYNEDDRQCQNLRECTDEYPCPDPVDGVTSSFCVEMNPPQLFQCGCLPGFDAVLPASTSDPVPIDWRPEACIDVDECSLGTPCSVHATCSNTAGSFTCECIEGYVGDGMSCVVAPTNSPSTTEEQIDECNNSCRTDEHQVCKPSEENPGTFACLCADGFDQFRENSKCSDTDECDPVNPAHDCHQNGYCINIPGSFLCECLPGYHGNGKDCLLVTPSPTTAPPTLAPVTGAPVTPRPTNPPGPSCFGLGTDCTANGQCCSGNCA